MGKRTILGSHISADTEHWERTQAWCQANGIDPAQVLAVAPIVIDYDARTITVTELVRHEEDPRRMVIVNDELVKVERAVPMESTPEEHGL